MRGGGKLVENGFAGKRPHLDLRLKGMRTVRLLDMCVAVNDLHTEKTQRNCVVEPKTYPPAIRVQR